MRKKREKSLSPNMLSQYLGVNVFDVDSVKKNLSAGRFVKAFNKCDDGALAAATSPDESNRFSRARLV